MDELIRRARPGFGNQSTHVPTSMISSRWTSPATASTYFSGNSTAASATVGVNDRHIFGLSIVRMRYEQTYLGLPRSV